MSPTFTSGRLKSMLEPIEGIADNTIDYIAELVQKKPELDLKSILQGFTLDSIARVAFGLETKAYKGENADFSKMAFDVFEDFKTEGWTNTIFFNIIAQFPELTKNISIWPESAIKIRTMTRDIMNTRDEKNIKIGDFVDLLREFKKVAQAPITEGQIEAQGMVFLTAGFETTATTLGKKIVFFILCSQLIFFQL